LIILVASQPDIQSQFQQILDIGVDKTFQIGENLPQWYSIRNLSLFTEAIRMKPIFLMTKDGGEIEGYHIYSISIAADTPVALTGMEAILKNCDFSVRASDSSDFLIDCHSDSTRIVWSSDKAKIVNDSSYSRTYEIYHKYSYGKKTWHINVFEREKLMRNVEVFWTRQ
jgi:hypothetical protein